MKQKAHKKLMKRRKERAVKKKNKLINDNTNISGHQSSIEAKNRRLQRKIDFLKTVRELKKQVNYE